MRSISMIKELPDRHPLKGSYVHGIYDPDAVVGWTEVSTKEIVDKINELVREANRLRAKNETDN